MSNIHRFSSPIAPLLSGLAIAAVSGTPAPAQLPSIQGHPRPDSVRVESIIAAPLLAMPTPEQAGRLPRAAARTAAPALPVVDPLAGHIRPDKVRSEFVKSAAPRAQVPPRELVR
jgi:hypothetical protein